MRPSDSLVSFDEKLRSPLASRLPRRGRLFFAFRPATRASADELRVGILVRLPVLPLSSEEKRGPPRFLGRPLPACQGRTPRRMQPPLAYFSCGKTAVAFRGFSTLGIRNGHKFRGRCPSARTLARLRIAGRVAAPVARLATGWGGYPFAGRVSHPLDDIPNFMNSSHDSLLSDQPFLVALKGLCSTAVPRRSSLPDSGRIS